MPYLLRIAAAADAAEHEAHPLLGHTVGVGVRLHRSNSPPIIAPQ